MYRRSCNARYNVQWLQCTALFQYASSFQYDRLPAPIKKRKIKHNNELYFEHIVFRAKASRNSKPLGPLNKMLSWTWKEVANLCINHRRTNTESKRYKCHVNCRERFNFRPPFYRELQLIRINVTSYSKATDFIRLIRVDRS